MEMNAEIGVMQPQAKEPLEPPEARRERKDSPQSLSRGHGPAHTLISLSWPPEPSGASTTLMCVQVA